MIVSLSSLATVLDINVTDFVEGTDIIILIY